MAEPPAGLCLRELGRHEVGYDYRQAVVQINQHLSYDQIAGFCGYKSKGSVADIAAGHAVPDHPKGEALYILYVELFKHKPPNVRQTERDDAP
jgi:hypothetical protein